MKMEQRTSAERDVGTAYGRKAPRYDPVLTEVGPGTPMGELLRRYWHPIGLVSDATNTPRKVRVLGEDLILFRDLSGRVGLIHPNCTHRGTSLYYGKVEERGIRCCYHGWMFNVEGRCVDQPCEPDGGRAREKIRQPWYPVQEQYGLIWAYMGPAEKKPMLPRYEALEVMGDGEFLEADDSSIGGGGPQILDFNWFQHFENIVDHFHVYILHATFSGTQFVDQMAILPQVTWDTVELGVRTTAIRKLPDGKVLRRVTQAAVPTLRVVPSPRIGRGGLVESLGWVLPIDDYSFRIFVVGRVREKGELAGMRTRMEGKLWDEMSEQEHQRMPDDYEAQRSQGTITWHSDEHLATSDRGIVMLRRYMKLQIEKVQRGEDPAGVSFDPAAKPIAFDAGNYVEESVAPGTGASG